jgi:hypothetical protein
MHYSRDVCKLNIPHEHNNSKMGVIYCIHLFQSIAAYFYACTFLNHCYFSLVGYCTVDMEKIWTVTANILHEKSWTILYYRKYPM